MLTKQLLTIALLVAAATSCDAFTISSSSVARTTRLHAEEAEEKATEVPEGMNPDNPNLPALKGDFDWDAKFAGDDDWITENVPGKIVLNEIELAQQATEMNKLEEKWRKERQFAEYEAERNVGWTANAELLNGRFAMFFLVTGLLTEYWTGVSLPGQVEELLRIGGFIGFD
uniref:High light inducible protein n=1 Tax=Craspedostauros australis TaxID=1486917 RepID=A0A7R9WRJ7_9STRA|mmetsp:Transcript_1497/g.4129  ORF Transcript_1497/g.4129 Transcript_1497/m.4129 type:complete len:172 (+) Transcript_1497:232-747(+)